MYTKIVSTFFCLSRVRKYVNLQAQIGPYNGKESRCFS